MKRWSGRGVIRVFPWRHLQWHVQREVLRFCENLCSAEIVEVEAALQSWLFAFPQAGSAGEAWRVRCRLRAAKRPLVLLAQTEKRPCGFVEREASCVPCCGRRVRFSRLSPLPLGFLGNRASRTWLSRSADPSVNCDACLAVELSPSSPWQR